MKKIINELKLKFVDRFYFKITPLNLSLSIILSLFLTMVLIYPVLVKNLGGAFKYDPELVYTEASPGALKLIEEAFSGIGPGQYRDYHLHIIGTGRGNTGCHVSQSMQTWLHPIEHLKFDIYQSASGITDHNRVDQQYLERLVRLIRSIKGHGKYYILGFDYNHSKDGRKNKEKSPFAVPNKYVFDISKKYSDIFIPVVSIHPYRKDALSALEYWGKKGIKMVKWLPNTMGMDPSDPDIDPYYKIMKKYKMVLMTHTGEEQAIEAETGKMLGNPLLLKRPLDLGVKVIMAHCASLGKCKDLSKPGKPEVKCFDLFMRMMGIKKYEGLLFGGISALAHFNRIPVPLATVLKNKDLHSRLTNGSDYPLPSSNAILRTSDLVEDGFLTEEERKYLNEIYLYNPLLFEFVLKRTVGLDSEKNVDQKKDHKKKSFKLPASLFKENKGL